MCCKQDFTSYPHNSLNGLATQFIKLKEKMTGNTAALTDIFILRGGDLMIAVIVDDLALGEVVDV